MVVAAHSGGSADYLDSGHSHIQGGHMSEKPGYVGELYRCQGNVRNFTKSHGNVRELSGKKSCHGKLHMRTEDCVTFIIFHYSVAVDGTGFMMLSL